MTTSATLLGISNGQGRCEHCGRTLARLFRIRTADGIEMLVGRTCSAKMTGYSWTIAYAERVQRHAVRVAAARAKWGGLYAEAEAARDAFIAQWGRSYGSGLPGEALGMMEEQPAWITDDEARAFVARCLA